MVEKALKNYLNSLNQEISQNCVDLLANNVFRDDKFTVIHEVNGKWRVWANFKTLCGAERCAAKVTTRPVKILFPNASPMA